MGRLIRLFLGTAIAVRLAPLALAIACVISFLLLFLFLGFVDFTVRYWGW